MRLEVTLSGEFYTICALRLTRGFVNALKDAFADGWREALEQLAVGDRQRQTLDMIRDATGEAPPVEYRRKGVLLGSETLAVSVALDGADMLPEEMDQNVSVLRPHRMMEEYAHEDVMAVFALTGGGFLRCVFEGVEEFEGPELCLVCEEGAKLMNRAEGFELVHTMSYAGKAPEDMECAAAARLAPVKQTFHVKRR